LTPSEAKPHEDALQPLREEIDRIDSELLRLLNRRAEIALEVGRTKAREKGTCFYVPRRERDIFERLRRETAGPFPNHAIPSVFREIISACRSLETPLNISYLGPVATFSHQAALQKFGDSANLIPCDTFSDVFRMVEKGECHYGVVAFRNSTHGVVSETLDNFQRSDLRIYAETFLDVRQQFLSNSKPEDIVRIYSHGQGFAQCREWLERHFPGISHHEVASTSLGAELASKEPGTAAIASELASKIYDIPVLFPNIEDRSHNTTRFVVIGHDAEKPTGRDKTSMILHVRNAPGALFNALKPFHDMGINLTHIDSRPTKSERWASLFFVEFQGHVEEARVQKALDELQEFCLNVKLLGSYPDEDKSILMAAPADAQEAG
jgi:chorismate mutase/prephenate dehydratase